MKVRNVKQNYILNLFRVLSSAIIGIVTMPYINKVLGAESLGKVEYVNTIINYFLLFSALGIPMYGIREIARVRDNIKERSKTVVELLVILGITSLFSYILLFGVLYQLHFFQNYKDLIFLMSSMVLLSNVGAEWYFQGMEDQLYITIRFVIVRVTTLVLLFVLVKSADDYLYYALIIVLTLCGSNLFNILYLVKTLEFKNLKWNELDVKRHLKPILTIFVAAISVNIYLQLDNFLIGSIAGDKYVGFYAVSNKLVRFVISFITIIGAVLLPRLTTLYQNDRNQYYIYLRKAFNFILLLSFPFTILFLVFSKNIIAIIAGPAFESSILTMQILAPLCIIVGIAYFMGYLVLYTQDKESVYTKAVMYSAFFSILLNYFAVSYYKQNGAAVVAVLSELLAIVIMFVLAKEDLKKIKILDSNLVKILISAILMLSVSLFVNYTISLSNSILFVIVFSMIFGGFYFSLKLLKENTIEEFYRQLKAKIVTKLVR